MLALLLPIMVAAAPDFDHGPVEIQFSSPANFQRTGPADAVDMDALANVLPLLDLLNQPFVKGAPQQPDFDPLLPLVLALDERDQPHQLRGPPDPVMPDIDPFMLEMMSRMGLGLLTPPRPPDACAADMKKLCTKDHRKGSILHCLSDSAHDLSQPCFNKIKGSIPHVCHKEIEKMCDAMTEGVLACLERNIAKLNGNCLDSYVATRHTVDAVKASHKAEVVNKTTGEKTPLWKSFSDWEAALDADAKSMLSRFSILASFTLPFAVVFMAGAALVLALYWYLRDGGLRGNRRVTQGLIGKCEELQPRDERPTYGSLTL